MYMSYLQKSKYYPLVACRMVKLTIDHGLCALSAIGLASMATSFSITRENINVAYGLGKVALALNKSIPSFFNPDVTYTVTAFVNLWKEPQQALVPLLLDSHKMALKVR